jgi:hypothetical protein
MFGFFSNSVGGGQRPSIKQTITAANLVATIPPAQIWYDFSSNSSTYITSSVVNGGAIASALDQTGKAHPTNSKGGSVIWRANAAGTLGAADMSASGGGQFVTNTTVGTSKAGMSLIIVAKPIIPSSSAATQYLSATEQGDLEIFFTGGTWKVLCSGGTGTPTTPIPMTTGTWQTFSFVYNGTSSLSNAQKLRFRYNKADVALTYSGTIGTTTNSSNATMNWFVQNPGPVNPFRGYVGEVLLFDAALNPGQVAAVETYLGNKWGI